MKKYQLVSFGEALIDFTPTSDGAYFPNPGGAPFNLAVCTAKYGCKTAFLGKLGKDAFGTLLLNTAKKHGVATEGVVLDAKRVTTHAFLTINSDGERDFVFCRKHGADAAIKREELNEELIKSTEVFHFGGLSLTDAPLANTCRYAVELAKKAGATISFDPNYRAMLWESEEVFCNRVSEVLPLVDILKVSEEEAALLTGEKDMDKALTALSGVPTVLITLGKNGALCCVRGESYAVSGYKAETVDTTGAGDIFFGTFLAQMLESGTAFKELSLSEAVKYCYKACRYAAKSTEIYGAIPSIPNFSL